MKIESFDKKTVKNMREEINSALLKVTKKYGVTFSIGTIRFNTGEMRTKLMGSIPSIKAKEVKLKKDNAPMDWKIQAPFFGFRGDEYGKTFTAKRKTFKVVGLNQRAKQYPVKVVDVKTGKSYRCSANMVLLGLYGSTIPQNGKGK